jgi:PAS domain S-box-containing protein
MSYLLAFAALLAAVLLRLLLDPVMGDALPLVTLFGAVAASAWVGGFLPASMVAILGYVACSYLFIPPRGQLGLDNLGNVVGLVAYLVTCLIIIAFGEIARMAQIRESARRELLRVTLHSIGDAVITTDIGNRITHVNAAAEAVTGWTQRDAVGQPLDKVFRVINEKTRRPVENPATRAIREGTVVGMAKHTVLIQKEGGECPIEDSAAPITDENGQVSGCVLIFRDVTAQRHMDREKTSQLHAARLLASIIESSEDAIISKSLDGVIQSWNSAAERLFGYTAEQAVGRHISIVIPSERIAEEHRIIASLKAGQRIEHFETERVRSDGRRILVSLTISPVKDAWGNVVGASKIVRDITDRKRAEDDLRKLAQDLAEADRRKNEFLAMLAHELRNPLAPIRNAARALRLGVGDEDAVQSASDMLERQVGQLARLVDDLLDLSRITRGKIELRKNRVELAPIVDQAVEAVGPLYLSMEHELTVTLPSHPIFLDADSARLAQVIGNLLSNAGKFTDKGGHVWLAVEQEDEHAVIRVKDNGVGIAAEEFARVFEMFAQVDTSLERSRDGLGIGLTLVKSIVELHEGTVEVHSDGPGLGSEFTVRLPTVVATAESLRRLTAAEPAPVSGRRILIVDDNEDGAVSLALLLEMAGYETLSAHDGIEAIEAAERFRPDTMLLDIGLPRLNGYEVCRRIRREPWGKDVVLIALTGWGQEEDRHRSREAGFDTHMVKPVDHDVLMALLASTKRSGSIT